VEPNGADIKLQENISFPCSIGHLLKVATTLTRELSSWKIDNVGGTKEISGAGELFFRTGNTTGALDEPKKLIATTAI
jgi:hypothetical protein